MRLLTLAISVLVAWFVRGLMAWPWWIAVWIVSQVLHRRTAFAHSPEPVDRPLNPHPLRIVNNVCGIVGDISFAAAVLSLIF